MGDPNKFLRLEGGLSQSNLWVKNMLLFWVLGLATLVSAEQSSVGYDRRRRLLQSGRYREAAAIPQEDPRNIAAISDNALATWLTSGGGAEAAARAVHIFTTLGHDTSLNLDYRMAALRNAGVVEATRDGSLEGFENYHRAYARNQEV